MATSPLPEDVMLHMLANQVGCGTYEAHVTIEADSSSKRQHFQTVCAQLGVKSVLIELPEGETRSQPMTSSYHQGTLTMVTTEVAELTRQLRQAGFRIQRVKLEAVASNEGVPDTDEEAHTFPAGNYFEFHVKLLLSGAADAGALQTCAEPFGARLSRNAFKKLDDGRSERFLTLRLHGVGRQSAFQRLDELLAALENAGFAIIQKQKEYAIFDSAVQLDAGWLTTR